MHWLGSSKMFQFTKSSTGHHVCRRKFLVLQSMQSDGQKTHQGGGGTFDLSQNIRQSDVTQKSREDTEDNSCKKVKFVPSEYQPETNRQVKENRMSRLDEEKSAPIKKKFHRPEFLILKQKCLKT